LATFELELEKTCVGGVEVSSMLAVAQVV